jgi:hypothetical protein
MSVKMSNENCTTCGQQMFDVDDGRYAWCKCGTLLNVFTRREHVRTPERDYGHGKRSGGEKCEACNQSMEVIDADLEWCRYCGSAVDSSGKDMVIHLSTDGRDVLGGRVLSEAAGQSPRKVLRELNRHPTQEW